MGVVYRLIPEVSSFIIEEKRSDPKVTCKNLAGRVFLKFGHQVSKSSVHELLKQAHVITPRVRKVKDKFQIPMEKKIEISKALAPFVQSQPAVSEPEILTNAPQQQPLLEKKKEEDYAGKVKLQVFLPEVNMLPNRGDIFLRAAWWDLSFKTVLGVNNFYEMENLNNSKLKFEWSYLIQSAYAIKLETQNNKNVFIDCRFQGIHELAPSQESLAVTIDRAACEVADNILNNINPLIIRAVEYAGTLSEVVHDFMSAFENKQGFAIKKVSLIGLHDQILAEFNTPIAQKRHFIVGIENKESSDQPTSNFSTNEQDLAGKIEGCRLILKDGLAIVTNLISMSCDEILEKYKSQNPSNFHSLTPVTYNLKEIMDNQAQWLKNRLKERAKMFFPIGFTQEQLEEALALPGVETQNEEKLYVRLHIPESFRFREELQLAVENVNNIHIIDNKARKVLISTDG